MSEPVQREDVSAATALKRLDDHEAPTAVGTRNVEKVLKRRAKTTTLIDDASLCGRDAWLGGIVGSASAAGDHSSPIRVIATASTTARALAAEPRGEAASQTRWLAQPENHDYFRGPASARGAALLAIPRAKLSASPHSKRPCSNVGFSPVLGRR